MQRPDGIGHGARDPGHQAGFAVPPGNGKCRVAGRAERAPDKPFFPRQDLERLPVVIAPGQFESPQVGQNVGRKCHENVGLSRIP